jgi:hypothetical protein
MDPVAGFFSRCVAIVISLERTFDRELQTSVKKLIRFEVLMTVKNHLHFIP